MIYNSALIYRHKLISQSDGPGKDGMDTAQTLEIATEVAAVETATQFEDQPKEVELRQEQQDTEVVVPKSKLEMAKEEEAEQVEEAEGNEKKVNDTEDNEQHDDTAKEVDGNEVLKSLPKKKKKRRRNKKRQSSASLVDDSTGVATVAAVANSDKPQTITEQTPSKPLDGGMYKIRLAKCMAGERLLTLISFLN